MEFVEMRKFLFTLALVAVGLTACSHNPQPRLTRPTLSQDPYPMYEMGTVRSTRDDVFLCGEINAYTPQTDAKQGIVVFTDGSVYALDGNIEANIELGKTYVFRVENSSHPEKGYKLLQVTAIKNCGKTID